MGLTTLRLNERHPPVADESKILSALSGFLTKQGFAVVFALVFLWWMNEDRKAGAQATALQLKDLNGQVLHLSGLLEEHHTSGKELTRILLAQCLNLAKDAGERDRCLGYR